MKPFYHKSSSFTVHQKMLKDMWSKKIAKWSHFDNDTDFFHYNIMSYEKFGLSIWPIKSAFIKFYTYSVFSGMFIIYIFFFWGIYDILLEFKLEVVLDNLTNCVFFLIGIFKFIDMASIFLIIRPLIYLFF